MKKRRTTFSEDFFDYDEVGFFLTTIRPKQSGLKENVYIDDATFLRAKKYRRYAVVYGTIYRAVEIEFFPRVQQIEGRFVKPDGELSEVFGWLERHREFLVEYYDDDRTKYDSLDLIERLLKRA